MAEANQTESEVGGRYAQYVLFVLVLVYLLNFLDRNIVTILAESIKADLGLTDSEIGFLYGTAFAVFYAIFGIPLGRLADVWIRRSLIAWGLSVWSIMTVLSGLAGSFASLGSARVGVGVGEASATPAAYSMLSDYFPPRMRATVIAIYTGGVYIGAGLALGIGGQIVERWDIAFAASAAPFGLRGWQVAFFAVGLPGLLLALWVRTLREPVRGQADGFEAPNEPHPFRAFGNELRAIVPPLTLFHLARSGAGARGVFGNLLIAGAIALSAYALSAATGDPAQWWALALGAYASISWVQALRLRDRPSYALILGTPTLRYTALSVSALAFSAYGFAAFTPPYFLRIHEVPAGEVGTILGGTAASGGFLGVVLGGILADRWRRTNPRGRLHFLTLISVVPIPLGCGMLLAESTTVAYLVNFPLNVAAAMWIGAGASTLQDLVLPRMRAIASATYLLVLTLIGFALGPYAIGKLSDVTGSLRTAMLLGLSVNTLGLVFAWLASRHLERDEASMLERARAAGEAL